MDLNDNFTLSEDINGPLLAAVIGIEMLAGLITNSFVLILTLCYLKTMKQPSTIFLTNMLLANLTIAVLMMPFPIITSACGQWIIGSTLDQKNGVCQFVAIMNWYCAAVSTESLVLVSFDRFFFIVKAFQYKKYMTVNKAVIIVTISWILAAFLCVIPLLGFGVYEFAYSYGTCVPGFDGQFEFTIFSFILSALLIGSIFITSTWTCIFMRKYLKTRSHRKKIHVISQPKDRRVCITREETHWTVWYAYPCLFSLLLSIPRPCINCDICYLTSHPLHCGLCHVPYAV